MIVSISGILTAATPLSAIIETHGLGYELSIPITTAEKLPQTGSQVRLHTHVVYREDAQLLFGFATTEERDFFRLLIEKVNGVGPKIAIAIMSRLSVASLAAAIRTGDTATLARCPGIGKKTAERLVVELRGLLEEGGLGTPMPSPAGTASSTPREPGSERLSDAVAALGALGYKPADADKAVRSASLALGPGATTEQLIKRALAGG
jgi:holliday junction DNA helicase RuvA